MDCSSLSKILNRILRVLYPFEATTEQLNTEKREIKNLTYNKSNMTSKTNETYLDSRCKTNAWSSTWRGHPRHHKKLMQSYARRAGDLIETTRDPSRSLALRLARIRVRVSTRTGLAETASQIHESSADFNKLSTNIS